MKKILNLVCILIIVLIFIINIEIRAKSFDFKYNKNLEIYEIKDKDDFNKYNGNLIEFYRNNRLKKFCIEKKVEQIERDLTIPYAIVNYALNFVGYPYVMGGNSLTDGTDCSGFVQLIFSNFEVYLPRTTYAQSVSGIELSIEDIEVGDIISYGYDGNVTHSAIYIGNDRIVHASTPELGIRTDSMYIMPIITIRRVV